MRSTTQGLIAASIVLVSLPAGAQSPAATLQTIEPVDIVDLREVSDPQISPDGRLVAYTVLRRLPEGQPDDTSIWLVAADGRTPARPLIFSDGADATPRWSPDNKHIAFLSSRANPLSGQRSTTFKFSDATAARDRDTPPPSEVATRLVPPAAREPGEAVPLESETAQKPDALPPRVAATDQSRQLWLLSMEGGEAQPLTWLSGNMGEFRWSPDGKRIAFLLSEPETKVHHERVARKQDAIEVDRHPLNQHLWIYDLQQRSAKRVSPVEIHISNFGWSPDSTQLVVRFAKTPDINAHWYRSRVAILDLASGKLGAPFPGQASSVTPSWSYNGQRIAYAEILKDGIGGEPRIYDVKSGKVTACGGDYAGLVGETYWSRDNNTLIAHTFQNTRTGISRLDVRDCKLTKITDADAMGPYGLSLSADGRTIAYAGSSFRQTAEVWVLEGKRHQALTNTNPQVAGWNLGAGREVSWTSTTDGKTIHGVLITPPGYVNGTPTKTVVQIHGGPEWAWWSGWHGSWHEWAQLLASHGYVVFMPNPRGSDGQGTAFARAAREDWGGGDFQDVLDGVDLLIKQRITDPAKLGIGGWSYGGFMSTWAITHSERFKAAVVGAAVVDLASMGLTTDTPDFITGYFGDNFANHALYDEHSPIRSLHRAKAPTLVLHGELDARVPVDQGEQVYVGLREMGGKVEMVRYPREPHWLREYEHHKDVLTRVLAWFDEHL